VAVLGLDEQPPALLAGEPEGVALFSERGPEVRGALQGADGIRQLLLRLEVERRSGSLLLLLESGPAAVTFAMGRVMDAAADGRTAAEALDAIVRATTGSYRFSRELTPGERTMDLWVSDFLRVGCDTTRRWKGAPDPPPPDRGSRCASGGELGP
jgi:hypothetical protein